MSGKLNGPTDRDRGLYSRVAYWWVQPSRYYDSEEKNTDQRRKHTELGGCVQAKALSRHIQRTQDTSMT